jgi:hypothetical protein
MPIRFEYRRPKHKTDHRRFILERHENNPARRRWTLPIDHHTRHGNLGAVPHVLELFGKQGLLQLRTQMPHGVILQRKTHAPVIQDQLFDRTKGWQRYVWFSYRLMGKK